ncbi:NAD(P)-binding protein [Patellaria atrata CBS 101060]|uniref:NAD(P)-binding protein n=1 Tax=Patellaria atrata CBS 101060 TaxID=1346257 RepID=A0A9P4S6Q3_9PEZI|nr:NAD(P)-binding protein [Patellaria atrata CBS 101060]
MSQPASSTAPSASAPTASSTTSKPSRPRSPHFPPHNAPRTWFLANGTSPIAVAVTRKALEHGDCVVLGIGPGEWESERGEELRGFVEDLGVGDRKCISRGEDGLDGRERAGSRTGDGLRDGGRERGAGDGRVEGKGDRQERECREKRRWRGRLRIVGLDAGVIAQCQAAIAEAVEAFCRIDVLVGMTGEALVGSVEELAQTERTFSAVRDQFETNFFANVNLIRAVLPTMREKQNGHIVMLTGITAHLGTPGLGMYCASQWAIEGYCDSLAYEIAPFNIKMTIMQPNLEINVLTNRITAVPQMTEYSPVMNGAPLSREILSGLLDKLEGHDSPSPTSSSYPSPKSDDDSFNSYASDSASPSSPSSDMDIDDDRPPRASDALQETSITSFYPPLVPQVRSALIAETVFALLAIGGHDNPPARHIIGHEGVTAVKEKLKTISEELEDFCEVSALVDFVGEEGDGVGVAPGGGPGVGSGKEN